MLELGPVLQNDLKTQDGFLSFPPYTHTFFLLPGELKKEYLVFRIR